MNIHSPLVSVLMTAYNRQPFIAEAIESVIASTYQNWELIIVDDCSKDETVAIANSYAAKDNRIRVYVNEKNLGDYPNRNRAASYAKGEYLKYLDADDILYPYSLQIMVDALIAFPEVALALSQNLIDDVVPYPRIVNPEFVARTNFLERNIINVGPSASIIRRSVFEKLDGFSGEQYIGDTELWMRLSFTYPICLLQPSLVWWRIHDGQQINNERKDLEIVVKRHLLNKRMIRELSTPLNNFERSLAIKKLNRRMLMNVLINVLRGRFITGSKLFWKSEMGIRDIFTAIFH